MYLLSIHTCVYHLNVCVNVFICTFHIHIYDKNLQTESNYRLNVCVHGYICTFLIYDKKFKLKITIRWQIHVRSLHIPV